MGQSRFDAALRLLANSTGRRAALHSLGVATVATLADLGLGSVSARKKKKHKKKKHKRCTPSCVGKVCGDDGCGGVCGVACSVDLVCQDGTCVCASGVACQTRCCRSGQVCLANGDCARICTSAADCPSTCDCAFVGLDGQRYCIPSGLTCSQVPQVCGGPTTPPCPQDHECLFLLTCFSESRCVPFCST